MKVESNKTDNQIPKDKQTKALLKPEQSSNLTLGNYVNSNTNQPKKDFASILEGNKRQNELRTDDKKPEKSNENKSVNDDGKESKTESKEKKEVHEEKRNQSDKDGRSDGEQEKGFGQIQIQTQQNIDEINIPNGRSILHIADLERIISKIRSQNIANGKQVTIELKRSVFEGLQVKLTIGKDKSVIAEFIAANESVKSQLNARAEELAGLLKNRGVKLTMIQMSLSSDSDNRDDQDQPQNESISGVRNLSNSQVNKTQEPQIFIDSDTSYQA